MTSATMAKLGGHDRFAQIWVEGLRSAQAKEFGDRYSLAFLHALTRLLEYADDHPAPDTLPALADDQLDSVLLRQIQRLAATKPRQFATLLEYLGWRVELPGTDAADPECEE